MKNKINLGTKFIAFLALFMFSILAINVSAKAGQMKMHAIYVDRGDAIVIESNGHFMLVDSGISQTSEKVLAYLKSLNIPDKKIDYVISTHPDGDHVGGFPAVFKEYEIGQVIYSPCTKPSKDYLSFIKTVKEKDCPFRIPVEGEKFKLGDATVEVIYDGSQGSTYNEASIVMRVTCDNKSILLTGDLPSTMENELLKQGYNFKADVLKIGHHGAAASSCANFLDAVAPQYAVVSCGTPDICEFPKESVLQRLARRFIKLYRTADANVVINFNNGVISTSNKENNPFVSIKKGTITLSNNVFYATGKQIKPTVNLYVDGQLVPAYHYKITYSSNINTGVAKVKLTATEVKYVSVCSTTFLILPKKETLKCSVSSYNSAHLSWDKQGSATGYTIMYSTDKTFNTAFKYKYITKPETTNTTIKNLKYNTKYYFKIRAYKTNVGYGKWSKTVKIKTKKNPAPATVKIKSAKKYSKTSIYVKWKAQTARGKSGYYVQYSTNKRFKKNTKTLKKKTTLQNSATITKLKKKKTYYIRVRGYNKHGKGNWSKTMKVKLK